MFDAVTSVFSKIEDLGNTFVIPEDKKEWYGLLPVQPSEETWGTMQGIESEGTESESASGLTSDSHGEISGEDSVTQRDHDNNAVMFIDVICRVSTTLALWC
jgi:E3 ubiquitin-protein ligase HUWE1